MDRKRHIEDVTFLIGRFGRILAHQGCGAKPSSGVTMGQTTLLVYIGHSVKNGGLTISEIADQIGVSRSAITQIVDIMIEHGLVERIENPVDKRSVKIILTEKSKRYLKEYRTKMIEMASHTFEPLDDKELEAFHNTLCKIMGVDHIS